MQSYHSLLQFQPPADIFLKIFWRNMWKILNECGKYVDQTCKRSIIDGWKWSTVDPLETCHSTKGICILFHPSPTFWSGRIEIEWPSASRCLLFVAPTCTKSSGVTVQHCNCASVCQVCSEPCLIVPPSFLYYFNLHKKKINKTNRSSRIIFSLAPRHNPHKSHLRGTR